MLKCKRKTETNIKVVYIYIFLGFLLLKYAGLVNFVGRAQI